MKTLLDLPARNEPGIRRPREGGIALVIVLGFLVLITVLIVAYFTSVTTESSVSRTYANGAATKFLADSAVNIVMGQIAKGTQGVAAGSMSRLTWASQPGMIRTYDDTGAADDCYKLYSSPCMVIQSSTVQQAMAADMPQAWNTEPALYTDLNAPVTDASGTANFPIMDGNNMKSMADPSASGSTVLTYDSSGGTTPDIEGFYVNPSYVPNYNSSNPLSPTNNPVPMPVQWLYVLKDGTIIPPDPPKTVFTSGSTATFTRAAEQPSSTNPITGRIAFWTDDETCKLNINTASEGSPYAFPHTNTPTDMGSTTALKSGTYGYALSPPASGEYNRYPGHPATTCLSVAMGNWLNALTTGTAAPTAYSSTANDNAYLNNLGLNGTNGGFLGYLGLTPRYLFGGSQAGTVPAVYLTGSNAGANNSAYQPVASGSNRMFASFDELIFQSSRTPFPVLSKPAIEELKFFLTANSRAPELTPFNTPKVSMWPQWNLMEYREGLEPNGPATSSTMANVAGVGHLVSSQLLAFCSSFGTTTDTADCPSGKNEYFFQRYIAGTDAGWRHGRWDWDYVPRNQMLANYLSQMGNASLPGYGASIAAKYSKTAFSNLIIESLDRIRMNDWVNYQNIDGSAYGNQAGGAYGIANIQLNTPLVMSGTAANKLPTDDGATTLRGIGTYPVCPQFALAFTLVSSTTSQTGVTTYTYNPYLACQWFYPFQGFPYCYGSVLNVTISPVENLGLPWASQVTGTASAPNAGLYVNGNAGAGNYGGTDAPIKMAFGGLSGTNANGTSVVQCTTTSTSITFGGGNPVTISIWDNNNYPSSQGSAIMQSYTVTFPQVTIPAPTMPPAGGDPTTLLLSASGCSVRGVECSGTGPLCGDWRLLECLYNTVNPAIFAPSNPSAATNPQAPPTADYMNQTYRQVHTLRVFAGGNLDQDITGAHESSPVCLNNAVTGGTANVYVAGSLVSALKNTDYEDYQAPCVPVGMTAALRADGAAGDWDTGPGLMPDGPYVNPNSQWNDTSEYDFYHQYPQGSELTDISTANGANSAMFSPNRLVASPVVFGSLPTGADASNPQPWQTLLFCPNPAGRSTAASQSPTVKDHPGFGSPGTSAPDSAYLEFFTMPVVQPYAISEPLSTAGKVNLNYQLAPFTGIERSTALRGVLKSVLINAIGPNDVKDINTNGIHPTPNDGSSSTTYKFSLNSNLSGSQMMATRYPDETHYYVNRDATIAGLEEHYFANGMLFRYPSEICNLFLVPKPIPGASYNNSGMSLSMVNNSSYDNMMQWWSYKTLTGDNLREEPYDRIYPRVCTKSNTFTVHYRVQVLQKAPASNPAVWHEGQDVVASEYRGSSLIERYIDSNDPRLTSNWDNATINLSFTQNAGSTTDAMADLSQLYKFRVISTKKFAP